MIGASAAVSGMMAAAIRFAFQHGSFLSFRRGDAEVAARVPALSLIKSLQNSRVLGFLAVWFGLNIITGLARSRLVHLLRVLRGRRISAALSQVWCCFRCSIRCRARLCRTITQARCRLRPTDPASYFTINQQLCCRRRRLAG
jgi:hypothetical protein